jgi:hypothetical protein
MSESKQPKKPATPDKLAKPTGKAGVELSETALNKASGGAVFPSGPASITAVELKIK